MDHIVVRYGQDISQQPVQSAGPDSVDDNGGPGLHVVAVHHEHAAAAAWYY